MSKTSEARNHQTQRESLDSTSGDDARIFYTKLERPPLDVEYETKLREIEDGGLLDQVYREVVRACGTSIGTALDFGGGSGANLALATSRVQMKRRISFDIVAPKNLIEGIEYISGTPEDLQSRVPRASVDLILAVESIEHVYDPDSMIQLCERLLKPGGLIVITTPNLSSLVSRVSLCFGWQPADTEVSTEAKFGYPGSNHGTVVGHIRIFTFRSLLEFLRFHGLIIDRAFTVPRSPNIGAKDEHSWFSRNYSRLDRFASRLSSSLASRTIVVARTPQQVESSQTN